MMKRFLHFVLLVLVLFSVYPALAANPVPVERITLNETFVSIPINKSLTVKATVEPKNATNKKLVWTSSDESVATVKNGQIKAVNVGSAVITVTSEDGNGASASVEVAGLRPCTC